MSTLVEIIKASKMANDPSLFNDAYPYATYLGLQTTFQDGKLITSMPFQDKIVGNPMLPAIHGGVVGALLESSAPFALMWELNVDHLPKTINISIDYLRSAGAKTSYAQAILTKRGRRVTNVRVEAWQDDRAKPVAAGHGNFLTG